MEKVCSGKQEGAGGGGRGAYKTEGSMLDEAEFESLGEFTKRFKSIEKLELHRKLSSIFLQNSHSYLLASAGRTRSNGSHQQLGTPLEILILSLSTSTVHTCK